MNKIILGTALLAGLAIASPAFAADMPLKAPVAAPIVYDWSGFYIGAQFGEKWKKDDWDTGCLGFGVSVAPFNCGGIGNPFTNDGTGVQSFTNSGFRWGLYAGYNFQVNQNWLVGYEVDAAQYNQSSTVGFIPGCSTAACTNTVFPGTGNTPPFTGDSVTIKNTWDASLRGRIGYIVVPNLLVYGTGGLALQRISETVTCTSQLFGAGGAACFGLNKSETQEKTLVGYTIGGGLEWKAWQHVVLRGEYRYSEFQQFRPTFFGGQGDIVISPAIKVRSQIATFGIAYLFGGLDAPVAAKY